jgi:flagellar biosynthesis protein FlhA
MVTLQKLLKHTDLVVGLGVLTIVAMLIMPLPHWALDMGLVTAIGASVIILLTATNVSDPLQFSVFPSLLLITTLFRLSLSIAATKLILGTGDAGQVIKAFGDFVMGGNFVVGLVAFMILVIVQFMVITKGAERVSEVVARFTLDAMPGKQMAIDADLAAGQIDEVTARDRRKQIKREADFYGAMDGASKFVKGDAVAAIMIIAVNCVGGFIIGFLKGDADVATIIKTYTILSVGEGLVSQLPALLISTASGLMVTRAGQDRSMGSEVASQFLGQPKAIGVAGLAMAACAIVPGFPTLIFLAASGICLGTYRFLSKTPNLAKMLEGKPAAASPSAAAAAAAAAAAPAGPESIMPLLTVDPIEIEVGFGLTSIADVRTGGQLPKGVTGTRQQIASELGFVMPTVRIRDNNSLLTNEYVIKIRGEEVARGVSYPGSFLAIDSGTTIYKVAGVPGKDPVFGLEAIWVDAGTRDNAERAGYTVIEPSVVISTHLAEVVKSHAAELLSRQDVVTLIENAKTINEAAVNELIPNVLPIGDVQKVLQHLLRERIPIRDMVTILETMADFAPKVKDPDQLGELVRSAISRTITRQFVDSDNKLSCITLEPALERTLVEGLTNSGYGSNINLEPTVQSDLIEKLKKSNETATEQGCQAVLLCCTQLRLPLRRFVERHIPGMNVLAYNEVATKADVEFVSQVRAA